MGIKNKKKLNIISDDVSVSFSKFQLKYIYKHDTEEVRIQMRETLVTEDVPRYDFMNLFNFHKGNIEKNFVTYFDIKY